MRAGFCLYESRGGSHLSVTSQFRESSAALELGEFRPRDSRSHLCKTTWQRAKSFLEDVCPFICWSRRDMEAVTWPLQVPP